MIYEKSKRAIFLDRDGTLIEDVGYLQNISDIEFFDDTIPVLQELQKHFQLFIVTNQPGISEGVLTKNDVNNINNYIIEQLKRGGVNILDTFVCSHHRRNDNCNCIKPEPYFLKKAEKDYNIDLKKSFVLGDHPHDVEFAWNVGACGIYLLTGHGEQHKKECHKDTIIVENITEAKDFILNKNTIIDSSVSRAATIIQNGGTVAFPTETVYGLGADALNPKAVVKIFEAKERPFFDPLIVHISSIEQLYDLVESVPAKALCLAESFWAGPLTLVLPKSDIVPDIITAGLDTVAIRIPHHPTALELLKKAGCPIAAPSANKFGMTSPTTAEHVKAQLEYDIDLILETDIPCNVGIESTIISFANDEPEILRPGGIAREDIEKCIGPIFDPSNADLNKPHAPGMLKQHYAPETPMILFDKEKSANYAKNLKIGRVFFGENPTTESFCEVRYLSKTGDLAQAATNLYAIMRDLDKLNLDLIIIDSVPNKGIGVGINDRLKRATHKK